MRIGGLASGLDTDSMVKEMMRPHQMKADKVRQDKQLVELKQNLYRDIVKDMQAMYTKYFDIGSSANKNTNLLLSSNYDTVKFSSSDSSVVTARGLAGAKTGSYDMEVLKKAEAATLTIGMESFKETDESFDLTIDGQKITVSLMTETDPKTSIAKDQKAIMQNINKAIEANNKTDGNKKIDVKISYSELGNNIRIEGKETGKELVMSANANGSDIGTYKESQKAKVKLTDAYGNTKEFERDTNKFIIDNVEYTINGVSEAGKSTKLTGSDDAEKTIENIRNFVNDYNALIDKINGKLVEKNDKAYKPLTEEQKKDMSEDEIKLWNEKTKKGLLRNDDILTATMNELLGHISSSGSGSLSLKSIGIEPNPDYRTQKGKIVLDEEKLKEAFANNGEETKKLLNGTFTKIKDTFNETAISSTSKLAKRAGTEGSVTSFNNELSKKMDLKQKELDKLLKAMDKKEKQYYAEFTRLEIAMNKANAQMGQFMQSMG